MAKMTEAKSGGHYVECGETKFFIAENGKGGLLVRLVEASGASASLTIEPLAGNTFVIREKGEA